MAGGHLFSKGFRQIHPAHFPENQSLYGDHAVPKNDKGRIFCRRNIPSPDPDILTALFGFLDQIFERSFSQACFYLFGAFPADP